MNGDAQIQVEDAVVPRSPRKSESSNLESQLEGVPHACSVAFFYSHQCLQCHLAMLNTMYSAACRLLHALCEAPGEALYNSSILLDQ